MRFNRVLWYVVRVTLRKTQISIDEKGNTVNFRYILTAREYILDTLSRQDSFKSKIEAMKVDHKYDN